jgi:hypothetical protein
LPVGNRILHNDGSVGYHSLQERKIRYTIYKNVKGKLDGDGRILLRELSAKEPIKPMQQVF